MKYNIQFMKNKGINGLERTISDIESEGLPRVGDKVQFVDQIGNHKTVYQGVVYEVYREILPYGELDQRGFPEGHKEKFVCVRATIKKTYMEKDGRLVPFKLT